LRPVEKPKFSNSVYLLPVERASSVVRRRHGGKTDEGWFTTLAGC
jgi:hypothetical protein